MLSRLEQGLELGSQKLKSGLRQNYSVVGPGLGPPGRAARGCKLYGGLMKDLRERVEPSGWEL